MKKQIKKILKKISFNKKVILAGGIFATALATVSVVVAKKIESDNNYDDKIKNHDLKLVEKDKIIQEHYQKIQDQEKELSSKQNIIQKHVQTINDQEKLKDKIAAKKAVVVRHSKKIQDQEKELSYKQKIINEQIDKINNQVKTIKEKEKTIDMHIENIDIKDRRINSLVKISGIREKWINAKSHILEYNNIIKKILKNEIKNGSDNKEFNDTDKLYLITQMLKKQDEVLDLLKIETAKFTK